MRGLLYVLTLALLASCGAPRSFTQSGRALDAGQVQVQLDNSLNVPTSTIGALTGYSKSSLLAATSTDTLMVDQTFQDFASAAMGYAYDPLGFYPGAGFKVGLGAKVDVGYTKASGVNIFDVKYQFLKINDINGDGSFSNEADASIGFRYASQSYELPSLLSDLQGLLGYQFDRKDYILNLTYSRSLKSRQEVGYVSGGIAAGYSSMKYDWSLPGVLAVFNETINQIVELPKGDLGYMSYGAFVNAKLGYRYGYIVFGCSAFYQNYPEVELFGETYDPGSGFTIVPSLSIQINLNSKWIKIK